MSIEVNAGSLGSAAWKFLNTGLGAAVTAMFLSALGSNCSEENEVEIFLYEMGRNCRGCAVNDTVVVSQPCSDNTCVNRFELAQNLEIARLQAKEYSDTSDLKLFEDYTNRLAAEKERVNGRFETIFKELVDSRERQQAEICRLDKEAALNKQATDFGFISVNQEFARINNRLNDITKEVIPLSVICPQPLAGCVPVGFQGQVVNTTATGETNTVIMANKAAKQQ